MEVNRLPPSTADEGADFSSAIDDPQIGFVRDYSSGSETLLVAFGGIEGGLGVAPFEFLRSTGSLEVRRAFARDVRQCWYHRGVNGLGEDIASTAEALDREHDSAGAARVIYAGNSMGGYAALLFGTLTGVDAVIAFSPQTFVGRRDRLQHRDDRWQKRIDALHATATDTSYFDLLDVLGQGGPAIQIHYAKRDRLDRVHAERLKRLPSVELHAHRGSSHNVVRSLRDDGQLGLLLRDAINVPAS